MSKVFLSLLIKSQKYDPNIYGNGQIGDTWQYKELIFDPNIRSQGYMKIQKQELETDHQFYNLGIFSESMEFHYIPEDIYFF